MLTKGVIRSINRSGNRCMVELPLFQTPSDPNPVILEALISITPGTFNNLFVNDVVFVSFEENALEKPIILGKLFRGTTIENNTNGGAVVADTLRVNSGATLPATTTFEFSPINQHEYRDLSTPKKIADYIKWIETNYKSLLKQEDEHFKCFKSWAQWQLSPENIVIDDGDLDSGYHINQNPRYIEENSECTICGDKCIKNKIRSYLNLDLNESYQD